MPLQPGAAAPPIEGLDSDGPALVAFYKVTCPTCQLAAPAMEQLNRGARERFVGVVQDPPARAEAFGRELGTSFRPVSDEPPYAVSDAYGVRTVPTVFVVRDGIIDDVVESWDRDGWNRVAERMEELSGAEIGPVGDGLPAFKPG